MCEKWESCSWSAEGHQVAEFRCHQITTWSGMDTTTSLPERKPSVNHAGYSLPVWSSHWRSSVSSGYSTDLSAIHGDLTRWAGYDLCKSVHWHAALHGWTGEVVGAGHILKDVILRPGAMHIIMSFLGCIGTLMKGSGLDALVGSAIDGLTGIMSGNVRAMREFRMVSAALLEHFLHDNENNFDDILAHMEDGRKHPSWRHWVNNLLMPTLLAHQFLRAERGGNWLFQKVVHWTYATIPLQCGSHPLCLLYHLALAGDAAPSTWHCQGRPHCRSTCLPP